MQEPLWLPTPQAAQHLNVHENTLKRKREIQGGFLIVGKDYRHATDSLRSRILWNVTRIEEQFKKRSIAATNQALQDADK